MICSDMLQLLQLELDAVVFIKSYFTFLIIITTCKKLLTKHTNISLIVAQIFKVFLRTILFKTAIIIHMSEVHLPQD